MLVIFKTEVMTRGGVELELVMTRGGVGVSFIYDQGCPAPPPPLMMLDTDISLPWPTYINGKQSPNGADLLRGCLFLSSALPRLQGVWASTTRWRR